MRNIHFAIAFFALLLSLGCNQIIELDLPEAKPQLVVNVAFNSDSTWKARVTSSQTINTASPPVGVAGATVYIEENGLVVDTLRYVHGDSFFSIADRKPVIGHTYTLRASAPGYAEVYGTETVPVAVPATSVSWRDSAQIDQFGNVQGEFTFALDDPAGVHNHYMLSIVELDTLIYNSDTAIYWTMVQGDSQDPELKYNWAANGFLIDDATFDGRHREFKMQVYTFENTPELSGKRYFKISTITESYFLYVNSLVDYSNSNGNPFAEPVRMYSNMTDGMGIFAGISSLLVLVK